MLPFVLAHPSRSSFAAIPYAAIAPVESKVKAYLEERGIEVPVSASNTITLPGPTGCYETIHYSTATQTSISLNPPDFTQDEHDDTKLEHSNNDDTSPQD